MWWLATSNSSDIDTHISCAELMGAAYRLRSMDEERIQPQQHPHSMVVLAVGQSSMACRTSLHSRLAALRHRLIRCIVCDSARNSLSEEVCCCHWYCLLPFFAMTDGFVRMARTGASRACDGKHNAQSSLTSD